MVSWIDKAIDFLFSEDNRKYVFLFLILGVILRFIIMPRIMFHADEMGYVVHSIGFIDSGKLQTHDQDGLWFFFTDLFMKIFGVNYLGARFFSLLFGGFSIVLVYLLGKEIFNERVGFFSALILALSSYHSLFTVGLMDVPMAFFSILSIYFMILYFKRNKDLFFLLCWVSLGLAIMVKQIALLLILPLSFFFIFYSKKYCHKYDLKKIIFAGLIIILMVTPVLTYNYLLYKDKKITDMQFSRFFGVSQEQYASIANTLNPFSLKTLFISHSGQPESGLYLALSFFWKLESWPILFLSLGGLIFFLFGKIKFKGLIIFSLLIPFLFLSGSSLLPNHFSFCILFFSLFSGLMVDKISRRLKNNVNAILIILFLLVLIGSIFQIYKFNGGLYGKNEIVQLIDFKSENINPNPNSLVIVDSRIYRGRIAFALWDTHYLETNYFVQFSQNIDKFPGNPVLTNLYFIEAASDDSGWGSVKDQPEFNDTTEQIVSFFKEQTQLSKTIYSIEDGQPHFRIYEGQMAFKESAFETVDSTHEFFFYPVEYKPLSKVFDNYQTYGAFDSLLNKFAHLIFYLEAVLVIIFLVYLILLFLKKDKIISTLAFP